MLRERDTGVWLLDLLQIQLVLTSPIYMMQVFDRVLTSGRTETLVMLTLVAGIAVATMALLDTARSMLLQRVGRWIEQRTAPQVVTSSIEMALRSGGASGQQLHDLTSIRKFLTGPGMNALFDMLWEPAFVAVIWLMHPWLGALAVVAAFLFLGLGILSEVASRGALSAASRFSIAGQNAAVSAVRNAEAMKAMGMTPNFLRAWSERHASALDLSLAAGDRNAAFSSFSKSLRIFVQVGVLGLGALLVLQGELTAGGMIAASILLGRALAPVEQSIGAWRGFVAARQAYARVLWP